MYRVLAEFSEFTEIVNENRKNSNVDILVQLPTQINLERFNFEWTSLLNKCATGSSIGLE